MNFMMRILILPFFLLSCSIIIGQVESPILSQEEEPVFIDHRYRQKYYSKLSLLRRTYPLALHAKRVIEQYDKDLASMENKRDRKKYGKTSQKSLTAEFEYILKDLYVEEGKMLMQLIHRETGLTVREIISKYRGELKAGFATAAFKAFGHDIRSTYEPLDSSKDDWITEAVIKDIDDGKIKFNWNIEAVDREKYRAELKRYRQEDKKAYKEFKKHERQSERNRAKQKKKAKKKKSPTVQ